MHTHTHTHTHKYIPDNNIIAPARQRHITARPRRSHYDICTIFSLISDPEQHICSLSAAVQPFYGGKARKIASLRSEEIDYSNENTCAAE